MPILNWTKWSKSGKRVNKQKSFTSEREVDQFISKLFKKENFCEITAGR